MDKRRKHRRSSAFGRINRRRSPLNRYHCVSRILLQQIVIMATWDNTAERAMENEQMNIALETLRAICQEIPELDNMVATPDNTPGSPRDLSRPVTPAPLLLCSSQYPPISPAGNDHCTFAFDLQAPQPPDETEGAQPQVGSPTPSDLRPQYFNQRQLLDQHLPAELRREPGTAQRHWTKRNQPAVHRCRTTLRSGLDLVNFRTFRDLRSCIGGRRHHAVSTSAPSTHQPKPSDNQRVCGHDPDARKLARSP